MNYIFLDIDGVICLNARDLDKYCVGSLNRIVNSFDKNNVRIVFNTAWNAYTLQQMIDMFVAAGFRFPEVLFDQTYTTSGGGEPVRRWMVDNNAVGSPFVIIDDSKKDLCCSYGRLAWCNPKMGLTSVVGVKATKILSCGIKSEDKERKYAITAALEEIDRLNLRTPWLTYPQRETCLLKAINEVQGIVLEKDFLKAACLQ